MPGIQAPISHGGAQHDYVISHRSNDHTVSFRPPGKHHHVGSYRTERDAKVAAQRHADTGTAPPSNTESSVAAWGPKGSPSQWSKPVRSSSTKKTPARLDREIAEALSKKLTAAQREQYQARRRFGHPAALAFNAAAGRELSRVPPRSKQRAHATKKALPRVAYRLKLTPSEVSAVEFARGRYEWPDMLAAHMAEDGSVAFTESEMWQWVDDVESDEAGGHSPFPLASRTLAGKLQDFRDSVV